MSISGPHGVVDFTKIGSDLLRVVLEAIFDHHEALPVLTASTAATIRPALPMMPIGNVSVAYLDKMRNLNTRATTAVRVLTDRLVRGLGPLSLSKEALEDLITTLITTSVHNAVAKATWCWYACNLDVGSEQLHEDVRAAIQAKEKHVVQRLKDDAYEGFEKTCLALNVGQ